MTVLALVLFGLYAGSFVNAAAWRFHERPGDLSILHGRSACASCGHALAAYDLLPVVSWVVLRGRCRHCGSRIPDSPLVELAVPAVFVVSYLAWPGRLDVAGLVPFLAWLVFAAGLVGLVTSGLSWSELPREILVALAAVAAAKLALTVLLLHGGGAALLSALSGAAIAGGAGLLAWLVSRGRLAGAGGAALGVAAGALVGGPPPAALLVAATIALAALWAPLLRRMAGTRASTPPVAVLAMAPAAAIVELLGARLAGWLAWPWTG